VVATAGRVEGGYLNLVIALMLFVAMVFLVWAGGGGFGFDRAPARPGASPIQAGPRP
jgi:hypothetical protein